MDYVVDPVPEVPLAQLTQLLPDVDPGVVRIFVQISRGRAGDGWLYFRVVLESDPSMAAPSVAFCQRLQKITTALRARAARLSVPMFVSVGFVAESASPRRNRKTA